MPSGQFIYKTVLDDNQAWFVDTTVAGKLCVPVDDHYKMVIMVQSISAADG